MSSAVSFECGCVLFFGALGTLRSLTLLTIFAIGTTKIAIRVAVITSTKTMNLKAMPYSLKLGILCNTAIRATLIAIANRIIKTIYMIPEIDGFSGIVVAVTRFLINKFI